MKRAMLVLIGIMAAGGMAEASGTSDAMEATGVEEPKEVVFDVEGTDLSVSDCNAVQGLGPCNAWEDGNKGYYRSGTVSDDDSIETKAIRRELLKQKAHEGVNFIEDMPKNYEDIIFDVGAFFAHKLIDQF